METLKVYLEELILRDKAFNIAKNPKYDGHNVDLFQWSVNFLIKTSLRLQINLLPVVVLKIIISSQQLAEELHKPIIRKSKKRKVHSPFIDNI